MKGKESALIDMGYRSSADNVIRDLADHGFGPDSLDYLLPTHVHLDHCGSCGTLAKRFANAQVRVHPKGEPHLVDPSRLVKGAGELFGDALMAKYGSPDPIEKRRLRGVSDEEQISLGDGITLRAVWTPGHASHHLSYEWEGVGVVFTGDAVGIHWPGLPVLVPQTPPPSFNLQQAISSLQRIKADSPSEFFTPHYGMVKNARQWIDENVKCLFHWNAKIKDMVKRGVSEEEVSKALTDEVCSAAGLPVNHAPDHLRMSIMVSVAGFLRYLAQAGAV